MASAFGAGSDSAAWTARRRDDGETRSLTQLTALVAEALARAPSADALHAAALLDLYERSPTDIALSRAIDALSEAHQLQRSDYGIQLDLSGVLLLYAKRHDDAMLYMEATERALAATASADSELHARAGRNVRDGLRGFAPFLSGSAQGGVTDQFASLLELVLMISEAASGDRDFAAVRQIARALSRRSGDPSMLQLVNEAEHACTRNCRMVGRAHADVAAARAAFVRGDYKEARDLLASIAPVRPQLRQLAAWADVLAAGILQRMERPRESAAVLAHLRRVVALPRSPMIDARIRWLRFTQILRYGPGEPDYADAAAAVAMMRQTGDLENWANCALTLQDLQIGNGESSEALAGLQRVLRDPAFPRTGMPRMRAIGMLLEVAEVHGFSRVAEALLHEDVGVLQTEFERDQRVNHIGYFLRAALDRGDTLAVDRWLPEMRRSADRIRHPNFRPAAADFVAIIEGGRLRRRAPARAADLLQRATARMEKRRDRAFRASAYADAARARLALHDTVAAERLLERAVQRRLREVDDGRRREGADAVRRLRLPDIDLLAVLKSRREGPSAFDWRRAQLGDVAPLAHPRLSMTMLGDTVVAWLAQPNGQRIMRLWPLSADSLRQLVADLRASMLRHQSAASALQALHGRLLAPLSVDFTALGEILEIEADGILQLVPFGALIDMHGRSLGASVGVKYRLRASSASRAAERADGAVLIIADPATPLAPVLGLSRLRSAMREADEIAALYPSARVLRDSAASIEAVLHRVPTVALLHVAAHAVPAGRLRKEGALLLAPDRAVPDGLWGERAIAAALTKLRKAPDLVILAACASGDRDARAAGSEGLAGAWVDAGAINVIASLWPVADDAVRDFMVRLHRELANGSRPATALQEVQRQLESQFGNEAAWRWAAWRVLGR